jgi:hypothetical protein
MILKNEIFKNRFSMKVENRFFCGVAIVVVLQFLSAQV